MDDYETFKTMLSDPELRTQLTEAAGWVPMTGEQAEMLLADDAAARVLYVKATSAMQTRLFAAQNAVAQQIAESANSTAGWLLTGAVVVFGLVAFGVWRVLAG